MQLQIAKQNVFWHCKTFARIPPVADSVTERLRRRSGSTAACHGERSPRISGQYLVDCRLSELLPNGYVVQIAARSHVDGAAGPIVLNLAWQRVAHVASAVHDSVSSSSNARPDRQRASPKA